MTTGDKLWSDNGGRAELHMGSAAIRLSGNTGFSFLNLDDRTTQIRLTEGVINVRVRRLDPDETFEIDTPNLAFSILREGNYKIDVNEAGDTTIVTVRDGQGEVTGGGSAYTIHPRETGTFAGIDELDADFQSNRGYDDDFDRFCYDRDRREDRSRSSRYVSSDVIGYEDLDDNGGWRPVPEYGTVWFPHTTVVGWAPYRYGHWAYVSPWGWTWVDDAPWGFAPFHYGRWVTVGGVWGWVPCPPRPRVVTVAYVRPVYAPALVAWVGGAHWGVGVSVGGPPAVGVAWFPLGPRDVYCPSYHVSPRYVENVNVSNTTIVNRTQVTNVYNNVYVNKTVNVTNITYQNQHINNAVTATSQASFTSAQPVGRNMVKVNAQEVASAPVAPMTPAVAPQQKSFAGAGAEARVRPPSNMAARQVVAKTPPPPAPIPVTRQIQAVQSNGGRPLAVSEARQAQETSAPRTNIKIAPPARAVALPAQGQNNNNRNNRAPQQPAQLPAQAQQNNGRPPVVNPTNQPPVQPNSNRPPNANAGNPNQNVPNQNVPNQSNANSGNPNRGNPSNPQQNNNRSVNDRPPTSRPAVDPQVDQRQQQQLEKLRQQQDQERQKVEQKQVQEQQKLAQQRADQQRQQQIQQKQQQQLQQLEQKHDQQQQKLQQRQQQEQKAPKPKKDDKPPKDEKDKPKPH